MKRMRTRGIILTVIWLAVGTVVVAVAWAATAGKSASADSLLGIGLMVFLVAGALFAGEVNFALETVNSRVDDRVRHGTDQDERIVVIEYRLGLRDPVLPQWSSVLPPPEPPR